MSDPTRKSTQWIVIALIIMHAAFLYSMADWLWSREHYQFFPLILIGSATLAWFRLQAAKWDHTPQLTIRVGLFGTISVMLFVAASLMNSNWIGVLAAIGSLWTAVWYFGGKPIARKLRGPVFFLLLAVPLPLNLDLELIIRLQKIATASASNLLDVQGIWHTISGVAISTGKKNFMVEEACSGVHSLFSCLAAIAFYCVFQRYGFIRTTLMIVQSIGWVILANVGRVFLIVYAFSKWNMALDVGWKHELVGVCTYAFALLFSLSTAQLFEFLVPVYRGPIADGPRGTAESGTAKVAESVTGVRRQIDAFLDRPQLAERTSLKLVAAVLCVIFLPASALSYARLIPQSKTINASNFTESVPDLINDDLLPQQVGLWSLQDVSRIQRDPNDPLGTNSVIWTYKGEGLVAQFSVDGYYSSWHDLAYCYTATDWKLNDARNILLSENNKHSTVLNLYRSAGEYGQSWFSCIDSAGQSVKPRDPSGTTWRVLLNRIRKDGLIADQPQPVTPPVFQLQLMASNPSAFLPHETEQLRKLFVTLSNQASQAMMGAKNP